jgi:hypothetical protein
MCQPRAAENQVRTAAGGRAGRRRRLDDAAEVAVVGRGGGEGDLNDVGATCLEEDAGLADGVARIRRLPGTQMPLPMRERLPAILSSPRR